MSLKHGLLGLLNYQPMTGYELNKDFNTSLGFFWQATGSQIYFELDAMEEKGWLVSEHIVQKERPNKRVYSITSEGKAEFRRWLLLPPSRVMKSARQKSTLLMRVFFGGEVDKEKTLEVLRSFREEIVVEVENLKENEKILVQAEQDFGVELATYWKLVAICGDIMSKARLEWADKAIAILES